MFLIKKILRRLIHYYEVKIAPDYLSYLYWPFYRLCKTLKIYFPVNIASGTGHTTVELDNYLRKKVLKEIPSDYRCVLIRKADPFSQAIIKLYGRYFFRAYASHILYLLFCPLLVRFKEITVDCGLSRLKWQVATSRATVKFPDTYLHQIPKQQGIKQLVQYYQRCLISPGYFPLKEIQIDPQKRLPFLKGKVALVHIKYTLRNATAEATDPTTLIPSITYLMDLGYTIIFVGREVMPKEFEKFPVFNYSQSKWANFFHDILLFSYADLAITSGSGISFLADRMDKPYLYLNSWHLQMSMPSDNCIMVPTLVKKKDHASLLSFSAQMKLYESMSDEGAENFPSSSYVARNATASEILEALNELLHKTELPTPIQKAYQSLTTNTPLNFGRSICSDFFLRQHKDLL